LILEDQIRNKYGKILRFYYYTRNSYDKVLTQPMLINLFTSYANLAKA